MMMIMMMMIMVMAMMMMNMCERTLREEGTHDVVGYIRHDHKSIVLEVEGGVFIQENLAVGRGVALKTFTNHKI